MDVTSRDYEILERRKIAKIKKFLLNLISKAGRSTELYWKGYITLRDFYQYILFKKYNTTCKSIPAYNIYINVDITPEQKTQQNITINKFADCIFESKKKVIPFNLTIRYLYRVSHANLLIFRRKTNKIEHFEPHGNISSARDTYDNTQINEQLNEFIVMLNNNLNRKGYNNNIKLVTSKSVCPVVIGLQTSASRYAAETENKGTCGAWTLLINELSLKFPDIPTKNIIEIIFNIKKRDNNPDFLAIVIRGYINVVHETIIKYYNRIIPIPITLSQLDDERLLTNMKTFVDHVNEHGDEHIEGIDEGIFSPVSIMGSDEIVDENLITNRNPEMQPENRKTSPLISRRKTVQPEINDVHPENRKMSPLIPKKKTVQSDNNTRRRSRSRSRSRDNNNTRRRSRSRSRDNNTIRRSRDNTRDTRRR